MRRIITEPNHPDGKNERDPAQPLTRGSRHRQEVRRDGLPP